ncbi:MAG TPA: hypothetical protein VNB22_12490 [Pyrinomonadaceae bacterium]|nr:hypothetical protein [Pyrinomonadaceae bacterium]
MTAKRRLEITLETHETTVIRFQRRQPLIFCESCRTNTKHFSIVQAERILPLSAPEISRLADDKQIHSTRNADGSLMLCGVSLAAQTNE